MSKILIIAEKSSVCKKIKDALKDNNTKYKDGYYESNKYIFTYCVGHLLKQKYPEEIDENYKKWNLTNLPLNMKNIPLKVNENTKDQFNTVKKLMLRDDISEIVNLCDPDREGELIFRNLLRFIKPECTNISRMWLTTTESDEALVKCFKDRIKQSNYNNLYFSAISRSNADYLIGLTATRAMSSKFGNGKPLTVGRVQTPTLKIIVDRENEINNFVSKDFYKLEAKTSEGIVGNYKNENLEDNRFSSLKEAKEMKEKIGTGIAKIIKAEEKEIKEFAKPLYNLSDLQIEMNQMYKMSADDVLVVCQSLYENYGLTTYPRTSENRISIEMAKDINSYVEALSELLFKNEKELIKKYNLTISDKVVAKKEIGSHEALTPTRKTLTKELMNKLKPNELNVYKAICIRFLENFFPPAIYKEINISFEKNGEKFETKKKYLTKLGYLVVKGEKTLDEIKIKNFNTGDSLNIETVNIISGKTEAPKRFTEGTLLKVMKNPVKYVTDKEEKKMLKENDGIGTEATRSAIIESLKKYEYIKVNRGSLIPTEKGISLINIIPSKILTSVSLTAICERYLTEISEGRQTKEVFLEYVDKLNDDFVNDVKNSKETKIKVKGETVCKCPNCGADILESRFGFYCENKCGVKLGYDAFVNLGVKKLTKTVAKSMFTKGISPLMNLTSKKTGSNYSAKIKYEFNKETKKNETSLEFVSDGGRK